MTTSVRSGKVPDLSTADIAAVRASWAALASRHDRVAGLLYAALFVAAPELRLQFPIDLAAQRGRFVAALGAAVAALGRPADVDAALRDIERTHRRFGVRPEHRRPFGQALLTALADTAGTAWTVERATAWSRVYTHLADRLVVSARYGPGPRDAEVIGHRRLGPDHAAVRVRAAVPYAAGQYVHVEIPDRPHQWRPYSPVNPPRDDGTIDVYVRATAPGEVSRSIVSATSTGDTWRLADAEGTLPDHVHTGRDLLLVGGGTGMAPLFAIIEHLASGAAAPEDRPRRGVAEIPHTTVFVGARRPGELHLLPLLRRRAARCPWLDVVAVAEQNPSAGMLGGRLAAAVARFGAWGGHEVLLGGPPAMLTATREVLVTAGVSPERIHHDPF